jgi:hypothetical protein
MEAGRAAIARGVEQLQQLQFKAATDSLREGISELESAFALLPDFHEILDGYLKLAAAYSRLDRPGESDRAMLAVVRLAPSLDLEPGAYPALFIRRFHAIRRKAQAGAKGGFQVSSSRHGRVRLDGRDVGDAPLHVEGLLPGPHFVVVSFQGTPSRPSESYRVAVQAGQVSQVLVPERDDAEGLAGAGEARAPPQPLALTPLAAAPSDLGATPAVEREKSGGDSVALIVGLTVLGAAAVIVGGVLIANAANAAPVGAPQVHWSVH